MVEPTDNLKRRIPLRKRIARFCHFPLIVKQVLWRLTAAWLWLYLIAALSGHRAVITTWDSRAFVVATNLLVRVGFSPSSPAALSNSLKLLWLFAICSFSWIQVLSFLILYVPFAPLLFVFRKGRKGYKDERAKALAKARTQGTAVNSNSSGFALLFILLTWFALFGGTSEHNPLLIAMVLTALLFVTRVNRALYFATPLEFSRQKRVEALIRASQTFFQTTIDNFKAGKVSEVSHLRIIIWSCGRLLRLSRLVSTWLYGRAAKKRAALIVLVRFMINLAILGSLSILFWAFAIKYSADPPNVGLKEALLASASRAIPGVPDSSSLHVNAAIQAFASITAWLIFVLYAGPVASLFPSFQERVIAQTTEGYKSLRSARKVLYRLIEALKTLDQLIEENPELKSFAKVVILLRQQTNLREFLLGQPDYVKSLAGRVREVQLLRTLGVPLPDLDELILELSKDQITNTE
jgi:hypothetical protein